MARHCSSYSCAMWLLSSIFIRCSSPMELNCRKWVHMQLAVHCLGYLRVIHYLQVRFWHGTISKKVLFLIFELDLTVVAADYSGHVTKFLLCAIHIQEHPGNFPFLENVIDDLFYCINLLLDQYRQWIDRSSPSSEFIGPTPNRHHSTYRHDVAIKPLNIRLYIDLQDYLLDLSQSEIYPISEVKLKSVTVCL